MIDAKLAGNGLKVQADELPERSNVIDLVAALRKSLGQELAPSQLKPKKAAKAGGKATVQPVATKTPRKRA